jgi:hypothetical protein
MATLSRYLAACSALISAVLGIPPHLTSLRAEYCLRLTGDASDGMLGYEPTPSDTSDLYAFLDRLDLAWVAVLSGLGWDGHQPVPVQLNGVVAGRIAQTERVRLQNLIVRVRESVKQLTRRGDSVSGERDDWSQEALTPSETGLSVVMADDDDGDSSDGGDEVEMEEVDVEQSNRQATPTLEGTQTGSNRAPSVSEAEDEETVHIFARTLALLTEVV